MNPTGWQCFTDLCIASKEQKIFSELFDLLLTPEEKASLETRCLIIQSLLAKQKTQRQISEDLNVSIAKITRGSNELKRISPKLKQHIEKILLKKGLI